MDRLRDIIRTAGMGGSFGLLFLAMEEWLHWMLRHPNLRWGQLLQIVPFYVLLGALLGAGLGAAGIEGLAAALWVWGGYTALLLCGHALAALGWAGVPFALFGMLALVVVVLFVTRERGDEYRWGALAGGWVVTLLAVVLNTSKLGAFTNPLTIATNVGVVVVGIALAIAVAKALGHRRPRAGIWAFLLAAALGIGKTFLPSPTLTDMPKPPKKAKNIKEGVSVVVVLADGLRTDRLGYFTNQERSLTPQLDALASKSISYPDAQAAAPWGLPALTSALTGLYPANHGVAVDGEVGTDKRTLAEYLAEEAEYTVGMVVSNPEYRPGQGMEQGFHWYKRVTGLGHTPALIPTIDMLGIPILAERDWPRAERVTERVLDFVRSRKGSRWLVVAQYSDLRAEDEMGYDLGLAHLDTEIGRLQKSLGKDTWIVVAGTHGNPLDHEGGRQAVWQENLRVPIIVYRPFNLKPATVLRPVSTADLLPTLLGITESGVMARIRLDGRVLEEAVGLNSPNEHHVVLSEGDGGRSVRHQEWKLVVPNEGPDLLFNVEMDRGEESDLAAMFPDQAKELGWTLPDREPPVVPVDDDQATNEDLEQEEGELPEDGDVPEDPELSP